MESRFSVYILKCSDGTLYTGQTKDLNKRIKLHNQGKGAKYTRGRTPVVLVYYEQLDSLRPSLQREREIKKLSRIQKLALINLAPTPTSL